jgi:hypothetical protein
MVVLVLEISVKVVDTPETSSTTFGAAVPKFCPEIVIWFGVTV